MHCFAKPDANQHRKFLRIPDKPNARKKRLVGARLKRTFKNLLLQNHLTEFLDIAHK